MIIRRQNTAKILRYRFDANNGRCRSIDGESWTRRRWIVARLSLTKKCLRGYLNLCQGVGQECLLVDFIFQEYGDVANVGGCSGRIRMKTNIGYRQPIFRSGQTIVSVVAGHHDSSTRMRHWVDVGRARNAAISWNAVRHRSTRAIATNSPSA